MLSLVIASSILALILLSAAVAELFCRWVIEVFGKRAASRPAPSPTSFEPEDRFGLLSEPNSYRVR